MVLIMCAVALATVTGIGVFLTERVDRPVREQERREREAARRA